MQICPIVYDFSLLHITGTYFPLHIHISTFIWLYMFFQLIKKTQIEKKNFFKLLPGIFHVTILSMLAFTQICWYMKQHDIQFQQHSVIDFNMHFCFKTCTSITLSLLNTSSVYLYCCPTTCISYLLLYLLTSLYPIQLHKKSPSYHLRVTIISFTCNYPTIHL